MLITPHPFGKETDQCLIRFSWQPDSACSSWAWCTFSPATDF